MYSAAPGMLGEIPTAVAALDARYAVALSGTRYWRVRFPRSRTVDFAGSRRTGALRLNKKVY